MNYKINKLFVICANRRDKKVDIYEEFGVFTSIKEAKKIIKKECNDWEGIHVKDFKIHTFENVLKLIKHDLDYKQNVIQDLFQNFLHK